ncbi:MAG: hypothetical protein NZ899_10275 [Thermoguttaceae bacterium]|nr:hypothetical protein [Thermoguttaceae bacterium]MDW8078208.1 hypothetical protein [Thermoguttaceae bacterium]
MEGSTITRLLPEDRQISLGLVPRDCQVQTAFVLLLLEPRCGNYWSPDAAAGGIRPAIIAGKP